MDVQGNCNFKSFQNLIFEDGGAEDKGPNIRLSTFI